MIGAVHKFFPYSLIALFAASHGAASAATLRITPTVDVSESYTDNVRGSDEGTEADLITETRAGAGFFADGNRLDLDLSLYAIQQYHLNTDGLNSIRPQIIGGASTELVKDHFFLDGTVSLSETSTSREGNISARDRSLPSNRSRIFLYEISPRLEHRFGRWLESTLRYSHSESRASKPSTGQTGTITRGRDPAARATDPADDQKTDNVSLLLQTGSYFTRINSQLELMSEKSKSSTGKLSEKRTDLRNEYRLNRQVGLIARVGYEDIKDSDSALPGAAASDFSSSGVTGALGVNLTPGPRLDFTTEYGRKFDGKNLFVDLTYEISAFYQLSARYEQSIETQQTNLRDRLNRLRQPGIAGRNDPLADNLPNPRLDPFSGEFRDPVDTGFGLDNSTYKLDQFELGFNGTRGRNSFGLTTDLSSRDSGGLTGKEDILSADLFLSRRLQPRLSGDIGVSYSDTIKSDVPRRGDKEYQADAGLNYALGKSLNTSFEYSHLNRKLDSGPSTRENIFTIGLNAEF